MEESKAPAYAILRNDQVGRYLVATRDLEPGEEIICASPFVVGPKANSYPVCLGCYSAWPPREDWRPLCSKCGWPVCNGICENVPQHKDYECQVFASAGEKFNVEAALEESSANGVAQLECVTPLRLLLESEKSPERWKTEVKDLEAHTKIRSKGKQWSTDNVNIVKYLRERLKLERFSEESIQNACGILAINTHEVRTSCGDCTARGLYPTISLLNHNCVANTIHSITTNNFKLQLRARTRIPKDGQLFACYTPTFLPTILRREQLLEGKHFLCACARCSDPTELGTHLSSLKCTKCDNGIVVSLDSLDSESTWKCTHCEFTTSAAAIRKVFGIIQAEVEAAEAVTGDEGGSAIQIRETVIKKYHSVLHPNHAFLATLKYSLCQLYGRVTEYELEDLPDVVLEHKIEMCQALLKILDVIEPGYSRMRGMILYELHAPLLFIARNLWNNGVIDNAGLKSKMIEASHILKESTEILANEFGDSIESQIASAARMSLVELNESINDLERSLEAKYKLAHSEIFGRYFIAAKDLLPGEVILRESVFAVGPGAFNKSYMCFACMRLLPDVNASKRENSCTRCNVAIFCGPVCKEKKIHHTELECEAFAGNKNLSDLKILPTIMQILLPLRVWLLQKGDRAAWQRVLEMEAHIEERRDTPIWNNRRVNVIEVLRGLGLVPEESTHEPDLLQRLCSILDVNSFELRPPGGLEDSPLRGLYPNTAVMAHECIRNTHITVDDKFQLTVYASLPIEADQPIFVNYTSPLLGSEERRDHLRTGKYFECVCSRCSDPKELGSNLSTLVCPRCKKGSVTNKNPLRSNVYEDKDSWQCDNCECWLSGKLVKTSLVITKDLIGRMKPDIKVPVSVFQTSVIKSNYYAGSLSFFAQSAEELLKKLTRSFHPNHFFLLSLKQKMLELYKKECSCLNPDTLLMKRMVQLCKDIVNVLEIVEPGISRSKGIILWEMHLPLVLLADHDYTAKRIGAKKLVERLEDAERHLKRSLTMLLLEPPETPEGFLARQALQDYKSLRETLAQARLLESSIQANNSEKQTTKLLHRHNKH
ncbi:uncharacterized protein [Venturia canescens]|uniref:uncharacterized protein n=1 Tax=Venturia canescens TaxID=32260 RepID=UPI001C9C0757|nr:uncharacterized protein LOC122410814 [Venturia canescens]